VPFEEPNQKGMLRSELGAAQGRKTGDFTGFATGEWARNKLEGIITTSIL